LIPIDLPQATIITGKLSRIGLNGNAEYFASQIGNLILGGSGLNSRLSSRIRTEAGLSYSASSIWTTPMNPPGVLAAMTQTEVQSTTRAIKLISETLKEMTKKPPNSREVQDAVDEISNGFIFNFQNPAQVISRQMFYLTQGLPLNWLSAYLEGIQQVSPKDVLNTFGEFVGEGNLDDMVTVVVGDRATVEAGLKNLGPLYILEPL
jgi:predicted Zn-dependent peptidase